MCPMQMEYLRPENLRERIIHCVRGSRLVKSGYKGMGLSQDGVIPYLSVLLSAFGYSRLLFLQGEGIAWTLWALLHRLTLRHCVTIGLAYFC